MYLHAYEPLAQDSTALTGYQSYGGLPPMEMTGAGQRGREFYVTVEGIKQGKFKGESPREVYKDAIPAIRFRYGVTAPRDLATGQASGKRLHSPLVITKEWGAATPQFYTALVTNEVPKSVLIRFVRVSKTGQEEVYHTIKLTNDTVSSISQYLGSSFTEQMGVAAVHKGEDLPPMEDIAFTFQAIEIENKPEG